MGDTRGGQKANRGRGAQTPEYASFQRVTFSLVRFEDKAVASAEQALDSGNQKVISWELSWTNRDWLWSAAFVKADELPSSILSAMKRTAIFANPKFFELRAVAVFDMEDT